MTKQSYLSAVTSVIQEARNDIIVKLIVSIDRRNNLDEAQEVVDLALAFRSQGVVGVDLCGDVKVGLFENLRPAFERAKQHGFLLTLHFNEIQENVPESSSLLSIQPDRLGHATFLDDYCRKAIYGQNIPVEICMTSNILCKTVKTFEEHHIKELLVDKHPFILCVSICSLTFLRINPVYVDLIFSCYRLMIRVSFSPNPPTNIDSLPKHST